MADMMTVMRSVAMPRATSQNWGGFRYVTSLHRHSRHSKDRRRQYPSVNVSMQCSGSGLGWVVEMWSDMILGLIPGCSIQIPGATRVC